MEEIKFSENEKSIIKKLNLFAEKINRAYIQRYGEKKLEIRDYIFTSEDFLLLFFTAYKCSKYFKEADEKDEEINRKIFEQLQNIVFELYMIFEFEIFDESELYKEKPENEYEMLYNFNKTQTLIIKTRILWEKVMNFTYLAIEREELKSKKSKKKVFKNWCKDKNINFFDESLKMLEKFDDKFRTGEVHEFSKLKNFFLEGRNQNINLYCLTLLFKFSNEIIINLVLLFNGKETNYRFWQRLPNDISENLEEFSTVPIWVIEYAKKNKLNLDDINLVETYI